MYVSHVLIQCYKQCTAFPCPFRCSASIPFRRGIASSNAFTKTEGKRGYHDPSRQKVLGKKLNHGTSGGVRNPACIVADVLLIRGFHVFKTFQARRLSGSNSQKIRERKQWFRSGLPPTQPVLPSHAEGSSI